MALIKSSENPLSKKNQEVFGYGVIIGFTLALVVMFLLSLLPSGNTASDGCHATWWSLGLYSECKPE